MSEINYNSLIELGFSDPANNGWGCRIEVDSKHEIAWYKQDGEVRFQTKWEGFTRRLFCNNISDIKFAYHLLTGKHL